MSRNKYPEQTVEKILKVSSQLFIEKGYENTSMQDIVDHLQMSKGAIYHHFKSKEDLLNQLTKTYFNDMAWFTRIENNDSLTGLDKLRQIFEHELGNQEKQQIDTITSHAFKDPKMIVYQLQANVNEIAPMIATILEQGNLDGSIHTKDPKQAAEVLIILINIWMNPNIYPVSKEEFINKMNFLGSITNQLGIPIFDEKMKKLSSQYYDSVIANLQPKSK